MPHAETVTVYSFQVYDVDNKDMRLLPFKATRQAIVHQHHGLVLEGTGHEVPVHALDAHGHYRRLATGWGELD